MTWTKLVKGVTLAEYLLIVALVAVGAVLGFTPIRTDVSAFFANLTAVFFRCFIWLLMH